MCERRDFSDERKKKLKDGFNVGDVYAI